MSDKVIKEPEVLVCGDPRLKRRADEVPEGADVRELLSKMRRIMDTHNGVGLAATQIGEMQRVIVWKIGDTQAELINPVLELGEEKEIGIEGCLSVPGMAGEVIRSTRVRASGMNAKWHYVDFEADGLLARVLQHEVDHLNGVLFLEIVVPGSLRPARKNELAGI